MTHLTAEDMARAVEEDAKARFQADHPYAGPWESPSDAALKDAYRRASRCGLTAALPIIERALAAKFIRAIERANERVPGIEVPAMNGDNLAVTLCSHFDDGEEADETGWSDSANEGYDQTIAAIRKHYGDAIRSLAGEAPR